MNARYIVLFLAVVVAGCTTTMQSFRNKGVKKAAFELSCPEQDLVLHEIESSTAFIGDPVGTVGVEGCGKKATYINTVYGWVNNTEQVPQSAAQ
ncbi:hypothetical protein [Hyalangium versicolor]|uniref:hypothetical protein n=1 Tax=Hyalangium versicolor TaxID=2861190 RepID=UPI001CCF5CD6|nr:hypothetical protein [Hyalangium versicolor]